MEIRTGERTQPRDLVLEGGGVNGLGLVGAVTRMAEAGYRFNRIACALVRSTFRQHTRHLGDRLRPERSGSRAVVPGRQASGRQVPCVLGLYRLRTQLPRRRLARARWILLSTDADRVPARLRHRVRQPTTRRDDPPSSGCTARKTVSLAPSVCAAMGSWSPTSVSNWRPCASAA